MNQPTNQTRDRSLYEKVLKLCPKGVIPTMGTLREQIALANNNTTYNFTFNEQKAGGRRTDILLSIKDSFYVNAMSLGIIVERKSKPGSGVVYRYPETYVTVFGAGTNAEDLEAVYNGLFKAQIDRDVLMDKMSTSRFRAVPRRLAGEASFTNAAQNKVNYLTHAESDYRDGLVQIEPNLVLRGTKQNQFTLTLPQFDAAPSWQATDPAYEIAVVLEAHGFLIPGGAGLAQ